MNAHNDFPKVVLANPDLQLRTNEPLANPTAEHSERMLVIFDMLMSLFERAYLVAFKPKMSQFQRYLRRIAQEERGALIQLSS